MERVATGASTSLISFTMEVQVAGLKIGWSMLADA